MDLRVQVSFIYRYCFYGELAKKISAKWKETEFQHSEYCLQSSLCESKWFKIFHSILTFLTNMYEQFLSSKHWEYKFELDKSVLGFTSGSDDKESACNVGDLSLIPGLGRSPGGGHGNPLQCSCLENHHGQKNLAGYSPWGLKELDTTEWLSTAQHKPVLVSEKQSRKEKVLSVDPKGMFPSHMGYCLSIWNPSCVCASKVTLLLSWFILYVSLTGHGAPSSLIKHGFWVFLWGCF